MHVQLITANFRNALCIALFREERESRVCATRFALDTLSRSSFGAFITFKVARPFEEVSSCSGMIFI